MRHMDCYQYNHVARYYYFLRRGQPAQFVCAGFCEVYMLIDLEQVFTHLLYRLSESHTGAYMVQKVYDTLYMFGLQENVHQFTLYVYLTDTLLHLASNHVYGQCLKLRLTGRPPGDPPGRG